MMNTQDLIPPVKIPKKLKRSILLVGGVGVGKTSLAQSVAEKMQLMCFDPEEALRRQQKRRMAAIAEDIGLTKLRTLLLDLLLPFVESQQHAIAPCPPLLASHPEFWGLVKAHTDGILLEGMPLVSYQHVVSRELQPTPAYLPEKHSDANHLLRAEAKLFFYHHYWAENRRRLWAEHHLRVTDNMAADTAAIMHKIIAIQELR